MHLFGLTAKLNSSMFSLDTCCPRLRYSWCLEISPTKPPPLFSSARSSVSSKLLSSSFRPLHCVSPDWLPLYVRWIYLFMKRSFVTLGHARWEGWSWGEAPGFVFGRESVRFLRTPFRVFRRSVTSLTGKKWNIYLNIMICIYCNNIWSKEKKMN